MTRVIHTGDTHLGYRQYHSPERRRDFLDAFRRVVEDAIDDDVDAVVHAGDLFHDRSPSLPDVHGAIEILGNLRGAGIPFLAVVGNHERTRDEQWLDLFETLGLATRLGSEPVIVDDVAFYGLDFVPRSKRDDLEYDFAPHDATHAALVAHGLFTPFNTEWRTETVLEESPIEFDAVLLGDDHHPDTAEIGDTWVTYPGSTERASAAEREDRGYNIVTFEDGVAISRRGIDTRAFVTIDLDLGPDEGADRVRERVREEAVEDAVVIVTLEGDGEEVSAAGVEELARERGALIARVNDRREFEATEAEAVTFADPDEAVRERVRELGLSEVARDVDTTVRDEGIADSNVRSRVKEAVEEHLDGAVTAFTPADPPDPNTDGADDGTAPGSDDKAEGVSTCDGEVGEAPERDGDEPPEDDADSTSTDDAEGEPATERAETEAATARPDGDGTDGDGAEESADTEDSQHTDDDRREDEGRTTTMEDFL